MRYRIVPAVTGFLAMLLAGPAAAQGQTRGDGDSALVTTQRADLDWAPLTPEGFDKGMQIAVVRGDPSVENEPYVIRLRFPDKYRFPPHWHPVPENVTVLEGTFLLGMGERKEESRIRRYGPGDYLLIEPRHPHFGGAIGQTVIQLHGPGPFEIVVVGSPDDVRRRESASAR